MAKNRTQMDLKDDSGLEFALNLNYTKDQYEKAISKISPPHDKNQLLNALVEIARLDHYPLPNCNESYLDNDDITCNSSQSQSRERLDQLKHIYVDGQNVARCHGNDEFFSWLGVKLCADWFLQRGHDVFIFMPEPKCKPRNDEEERIISYLKDLKFLIPTPEGSNDDLFILEVATKSDGIIVSNDQFRDEIRYNEKYLKKFVDCRRLAFTFCHDKFIPNPQPCGRYGTSLEEFLKVSSALNRSISDKSHQRNRRKWNAKRWTFSGTKGPASTRLQVTNRSTLVGETSQMQDRSVQLQYYLKKVFEIVPPERVCNVIKRLNDEDVEVDTICSKLFDSL